MDYFACRDSVLNYFGYDLEITREQFDARNAILEDPSLRYSRLRFDFRETGGRYGVRVSFRKTPESAHLPSREKIRVEIRRFMTTLISKRVRPAVVTISRSCHSGYCPKEYAEFIESELLSALRALPGLH
jgi:hypothetical protein